MTHRDRILVGIGQCEQPTGLGQQPIGQVLGDAVTGEVEETDLVGDRAQLPTQRGGIVAEVDHGQGRPHGAHVVMMAGNLGTRQGRDRREYKRPNADRAGAVT